ncbi:MAG: hypothetical protein COX46_01540, partial [bacterium (Candidatus Ratteibacteria) CG23_combo_of_CG06-09_8_20_14_all_48_7]
DWRRQMEKQIGKERLQEGLFISIPYFCTSDKANDFLVDQLKKSLENKGLIIVSPHPKIIPVKFSFARTAWKLPQKN